MVKSIFLLLYFSNVDTVADYANNKNYRKDIDGLRAVAIFAVILHHLNQNLLPGGFIGVDIFFVISGFLITSHLYKSLTAKTFSFSFFYKKRINRIIPALLTVVCFSICIGFFLLSPSDLIRLINSALTSITGVSNIYFWREYGNYFSANTNEAILLHTWSLGVEEQFYLLWPIIILLITKLTPKPTYIMCLLLFIVITTLLFSQYATTLFASASYYLLPTRFFELAIGGLIAIRRPKKINSPLLFSVVKIIGLSLIFYGLFIFNEHTRFPGINALIPCLGACLVILSGNFGNPSRVLSIKPLQITGLLSYAMYLWHWPIIAYINYSYLPIDFITSLIILVSIYLLSFLTWKYIETPLRAKGNEKNFVYIFITRLGIPIILLSVLMLITQKWQGFPERFPPALLQLEQITLTKPNEMRKNCHVSNQHFQTELNNNNCIIGIAEKSIDGLLIGDSYANHFSGMIDEIAKVRNLRITDYTMDACPPILGYTNDLSASYAQRCIARNDHIAQIIKKNHYKYILLAADWPKDSNVYPYLKETIKKYRASGAKIIIILNNPTINHAASCPIRKIIFNLATSCTTKQTLPTIYWDKIKQSFPEVTFINPNTIICKENSCSPIIQNIPLYRDNGHLNDIGSRLLGKELLKQNDLLQN